MTIGENIRLARTQAGLTQKALSELTGIAEPTIRRYEANKLNPKIETITKIARAMGLYASDLIPAEQWALVDMTNAFVQEKTPTAVGSERSVSDDDIKFALFGDAEIDDELYEEVKAFARFAKERKEKRST